ncbi:nucleoside hydrolase [Nocardia nova]|uniref:nucleoside hydrolase n=1 Tax=Nocardia nova TaxID=37330 RepID=UPI0033CB2BDE
MVATVGQCGPSTRRELLNIRLPQSNSFNRPTRLIGDTREMSSISTSPSPAKKVLDTDFGHDVDDAIAAALMACLVDDWVAVSADEIGDHRARGITELLRLMDRSDVQVIRGTDIGGRERRRSSMGLLTLPRSDDPDMIDTLTDLCETSGGLHWIGCGPMTNLARFHIARPHYSERIRLTQMGGWLDRYRNPAVSSHNLRMDPAAAGLVLRAVPGPRLVLSDHTESPIIRITEESELYRKLTEPGAPAWAPMLAACFREWFAYRATQTTPSGRAGGAGTWLHDAVTVAAALGLDFVTFAHTRIRIEADARIYRDPDGRDVEVTTEIDYDALMQWVTTTLFPA